MDLALENNFFVCGWVKILVRYPESLTSETLRDRDQKHRN